MTSKRKIYLLGWITLIGFPMPTILYKYFWEKETFTEILDLTFFFKPSTITGLAIGVIVGIIAVQLFKLPFLKSEALKQQEIIDAMHINKWDAIFLSVCAGIGEELLFRAGIQIWLGPILTSVLFVAIHGYYHPKNWKISIYGFVLTFFIILIAYGYEYFGLWFAASAHAAYDWVIFNDAISQTPTNKDHFSSFPQD